MRIAMISLGRLGAGPMYSFEMAKALSQRAEIRCVVSSHAENIALWRKEATQNCSFTIYEVSTYDNVASFALKTLRIWQYRHIAKQINNFTPDVVYIPMGHFWDKFILRNVKCEVQIKTYHDMKMHDGENGILRRLLFKPFAYKTNKCIVLSDIFKPVIMAQMGYKSEDVTVIPHASFQQYAPNYQLDLETKYSLIFFGRLLRYKGLGVMLDAMQIVLQKRPEVKLLIVGRGDISDYADQLKSVESNIETHVRWIQDNEVEQFFSRSDIAVLPYTEASQSGVIPLANSFGKPAIATNIGGLPAQIVQDITGIVIPPNHPQALADAILELYDNEQKLKQLKQAAYHYSKENTWEHSAELFLNAYKPS